MKLITPKVWFLLGLALYFSFLLFQFLMLKYNAEFFTIEQFGSLGDFIAGVTAPIINIIAAILVYKSFQAQVKANEMQFKALKEDRDFDRIQMLLKDITKAKSKIELVVYKYENFDDVEGTFTYIGTQAIDKYFTIIDTSKTISNDLNDSIYTIENSNLFLDDYCNYLDLISLTSQYLIDYYTDDNISFRIIKNKFFSIINHFMVEPLIYDESKKIEPFIESFWNTDDDKLNLQILGTMIEPIISKIDKINSLSNENRF